MRMNHRSPPEPEHRRQRAHASPLASPGSRILVALLLFGAIWLPSLALSEEAAPAMVAINVVLTIALLPALAGRPRQRQPRRL